MRRGLREPYIHQVTTAAGCLRAHAGAASLWYGGSDAGAAAAVHPARLGVTAADALRSGTHDWSLLSHQPPLPPGGSQPGTHVHACK